MPIKHQKWITRKNLQDNPKTIYVFGDNMQRRGLGGQAKEMRGEPNAIGIPTKWKPERTVESFFMDSQIDKFWDQIIFPIKQIELHLKLGQTVIIPTDGVGTGLSKMDLTAPKAYAKLQDSLERLEREYGTLDGE